MKLSCRIVLAIAALVALGGSLNMVQAQGLTGQISGTVTDSGGGVLPGATVTVKNAGTNPTRETVTGCRRRVPVSGPARRKIRHHRHRERVQDLRTEGHHPGVDRARRASRDRARGRRPGRNGHRAGRVRPGADHHRRPVRADHAREHRRHRAQGPRLRRHAEAAAGRRSTRPTAKRPAGAAWAASRSTAAAAGSTSRTTASPTRTPARTAATTRRRRSTRSPRCACRPRTSRPSTAAARARRLPSSPAAGRRTAMAARRTTSATRA